MELDFRRRPASINQFDKEKLDKQVKIIKQASELAQAKIDYASAHDDHILRAIEIVENFLRKKHRLCYGCQAINAHLPEKYKFYNPEFTIPDYDFFSPNQDADIIILVGDLKKAGFTEISAREGMHEGTTKIYVEYIPVADITAIDPYLYRLLSKREFRFNGISYLDANTLRMLMYLELSRPRGEVDRWGKVYERLLLFNHFASKKPCKLLHNNLHSSLTHNEVEFTIQYIIENKRVFAGADLIEFYNKSLKTGTKKLDWIVKSKKPIIFYSDEVEKDSVSLLKEFQYFNKINKSRDSNHLHLKTFSKQHQEMIPDIKMIYKGKSLLVIIVHQTACHSYYNVPLFSFQKYDKKILRIATIDTLITLYFSLGLIHTKFLNMGSMECLASQLVEISTKARNQSDKFVFPFISLSCSGHQTSLPSLIRLKVERITAKKKKMQQLVTNIAQTNKRKTITNKKNKLI
jgi:hypothetical protein